MLARYKTTLKKAVVRTLAMKAEKKWIIKKKKAKAGEEWEWKIAIGYLKLERGILGVNKNSKISITEENIRLCNFAIYTLIKTERILDLLLVTANSAFLRKKVKQCDSFLFIYFSHFCNMLKKLPIVSCNKYAITHFNFIVLYMISLLTVHCICF